MKKIKILHFIWNLDYAGGGGAKFLSDLARLVDKDRFEISVCVLGDSGVFGSLIERSGVNLYILGKKRFTDNLRVVWQGIRLVKKLQPDIIHIHRAQFDLWGLLIAVFSDHIPTLISEHETGKLTGKNYFKGLINRILDPQVTYYLVCAEFMADFLRRQAGLPASKIKVIYHGVDLSSFDENGKSAQVSNKIGAAGRLVERKGIQVLLEAMPLIIQQQPRVRLSIAGDGPWREKLEERARVLSIKSQVEFMGTVENMREWFSSLEIFILPSLEDYLPVVCLEAMARGLPIIASRVGGTPEMVVDKETGILVERDNPIMLANAIISLLNDNELRLKYGIQAKERVKRLFNIEKVVKHYEELYSRLVKENT